MVAHVGLNLSRNEYFTYDTVKKSVSNFELELHCNHDITRIVKIFEEIKLKVHDELGCACICYLYYTYSFVKALVNEGLKMGFKRVQVIEYYAASLFSVISPLDYHETNGKIVTIDADLHVEIYQSKDGIVECIKFFPFNKLTFFGDIANVNPLHFEKKHKVNYPLTVFYSKISDFREEDFPEIKCVCCDINKTIGALYKARMMGNDPDVFYYDAKSNYGISLTLNINDVEVLRIEYGELLPLTRQILYEMPDNEYTLKVIGVDAKDEYILPRMKTILIVVEVNIAQRYTIKYLDVSGVDYSNLIYELFSKHGTESKKFDTNNIYAFPTKIQVNNDQINAVGIDLGTTRCCCAVNRRNGVETVALENTGGKLLSSWIGFDEEQPKCGQVVVDRFRNYSKSTLFDVKRIIRKDFNDIKIDPGWPFDVVTFQNIVNSNPSNRSPVLLKTLGLNMMMYKRAEEISAVLLKYIKEKTQEFQGKQLTEVVVSVPVAFKKNQKQATYEAAILAGGGTLDVCIFKNNQLKIKSSKGDPNIGGRDFDNLLIEYFEKKLIDDFGIKITKDKGYKLMPKCQSIKENLSVRENDFLDVEDIDCSADGMVSITRKIFEEMSTELLKQIRQNINFALQKICLTHEQIQMVLHVGGGCRMPMIKDMLQNVFPNSEHIREQNIDEVVAVGAAYYAYYLNQKDNKRNCSVM